MFLLILLGMLSAFGPFVTDMYLPSLPAMTDYFSTRSSMVQLGLTTSMIGLALGQIFFGPLSDKYGRRPLLLVSMILFIISTVFCLFAPDIYSFITLRLVQGIGGAGGIVISRSLSMAKVVEEVKVSPIIKSNANISNSYVQKLQPLYKAPIRQSDKHNIPTQPISVPFSVRRNFTERAAATPIATAFTAKQTLKANGENP